MIDLSSLRSQSPQLRVNRRRRDDRPHRSPCRRPHGERRQLPAPRPRHRQSAEHQNPGSGGLTTQNSGLVLARRFGRILNRRRQSTTRTARSRSARRSPDEHAGLIGVVEVIRPAVDLIARRRGCSGRATRTSRTCTRRLRGASTPRAGTDCNARSPLRRICPGARPTMFPSRPLAKRGTK